MSAILELQQTSCTSLRLSIDGTDRRTEGGHSTVTWTLNAYYASIKFSINNHVVKLRNIVCNLPICLQQSCPWVHFLWPNPTQPMGQPNPWTTLACNVWRNCESLQVWRMGFRCCLRLHCIIVDIRDGITPQQCDRVDYTAVVVVILARGIAPHCHCMYLRLGTAYKTWPDFYPPPRTSARLPFRVTCGVIGLGSGLELLCGS